MWIFVELMLSVGLFIIIICVVDGYNNFSIANPKVLILVYIVKEFTYFMRCINDTISTSVQTQHHHPHTPQQQKSGIFIKLKR